MNYHLKSKPKHEHRFRNVVVVLFFLFLSALVYLFPNGIRTASHTVAQPIWLMSDVVTRPFISIKEFFRFKSSLVAQKLSLESELSTLKLKETDYDIVVKENQDLKNELGRKADVPRTIAYVLSRPPQSPYDTLVIDAGSNDNIAAGDTVYLSNSVIVGSVTGVTSNTSVVQLFSAASNKQDATLSRTGASFALTGSGGANFQLEVPKDTDILLGDVFTYPGISSSVVANVYYIDTDSKGSFKTVYLRVPGNVFSAKYVFLE